MIITLDIITSFALLDVSMLSFGLATYHLFDMPPNCHDKASNLHYPSKPLFGYVTACSALLIALLVAGAVCSMLGHGYHGISLYHAI